MTFLRHHKSHAEEESSFPGPSNLTVKIAIIREELVALTHDPLIAVVLNQLLYWTQRVSDFDLLVAEENTSPLKNKKAHGWFYKSSQELIEETLLQVSKVTMRRYLNFLVKHGWLSERGNPHYKWDKTTQYRLNLSKLQADLQALGWSIPGFTEDLVLPQASKCSTEDTKNKNSRKSRKSKIEASKLNESTFEVKEIAPSKVKKLNIITETTAKTKNKEHTHRARKDSSLNSDLISSSMIELWQKYVGQEGIQLNKTRQEKLPFLLSLHFENDLSKWEEFCKRIKASPFLMGEGPNKWHITFNWILLKGNILKVLEGSYDSPETIKHRKEVKAKDIRRQKTKSILESITDPLWQEWCDQLSEFPQNGFSPVHKPLYWYELERISNARFLDFDGRLVTIASSDPKVLNAIEDNRFQLATVVLRRFPNSRGIRTELIPIKTSIHPPSNNRRHNP